jgi:hypothetical protein
MTEPVQMHIQAAEECLENAGNQAVEFKGIAAAMTATNMADVASLMTAVLSLTGVQASLTEATAHATLAIAKRSPTVEVHDEVGQPSAPDFLAAMNTVQAQLSDVRRERDEARAGLAAAEVRENALREELAKARAGHAATEASRRRWLDRANERQIEIEQLNEIIKKRDREIYDAQSAQSNPLELRRPEVGPGCTVALVGERTGRRYAPGDWWRWDDGDASWGINLTTLLADEGSLRVEVAPQREPEETK